MPVIHIGKPSEAALDRLHRFFMNSFQKYSVVNVSVKCRRVFLFMLMILYSLLKKQHLRPSIKHQTSMMPLRQRLRVLRAQVGLRLGENLDQGYLKHYIKYGIIFSGVIGEKMQCYIATFPLFTPTFGCLIFLTISD